MFLSMALSNNATYKSKAWQYLDLLVELSLAFFSSYSVVFGCIKKINSPHIFWVEPYTLLGPNTLIGTAVTITTTFF